MLGVIKLLLVYAGLSLYMPLLCEHFWAAVTVTYLSGLALTAWARQDPYVRGVSRIGPAGSCC